MWNNETVSIRSTECDLNTSIHINVMPSVSNDVITDNKLAPTHIQIYIGGELFVCTKTILSHLHPNTIHAIISFMLLKLIKW